MNKSNFASIRYADCLLESLRRHAVLLTKNYSLHIGYMPRRNFLLAPCLVYLTNLAAQAA